MTFRLAVPGDIDAITDLRLQMLGELVDTLPEGLAGSIRTYLEKHLSDQSCLCALLEAEGETAAMAMLCCYEDLPDEVSVEGKSANLASVYTLPALRGRGYMKELLTYLLEEAKGRGIRVIYAAAERKAMPLYQRVGFQVAQTMMFLEL